MKCSFCGHVFEATERRTVCRRCAMLTRCRLVKCPRCGYETPPEPRWLRRILERWRGHDQ